MRSISVDFTNQGSSASSSLAGYVDEHDATEISFNLPSEITDNTDVVKYIVTIRSGDKIMIYDKIFNKTEQIKVLLHRCYTQNESISLQIEGYGTNDNLVIKSPIAKFRLSKSISNERTVISEASKDSNILAQIIENSISRHTHENKDSVLDKLSVSNNVLLFNGEEIGAKDIEEISSNKVTYAYEDEINTISDVEAALNLIFCNLSNIYIEATQSDDGATIKIVNKDGTSSTVSLSNGQNGSTPQKGIDYWTESDIAEIKSYVDDVILGGKW